MQPDPSCFGAEHLGKQTIKWLGVFSGIQQPIAFIAYKMQQRMTFFVRNFQNVRLSQQFQHFLCWGAPSRAWQM